MDDGWRRRLLLGGPATERTGGNKGHGEGKRVFLITMVYKYCHAEMEPHLPLIEDPPQTGFHSPFFVIQGGVRKETVSLLRKSQRNWNIKPNINTPL